jgi:CRISPR-associated protein Cmx8
VAKTSAKPATPAAIEVGYDLRDLPSAQHKAGLAGLLLQIEDMRERRDKGFPLPSDQIPDVVERTATTARIRFTEGSAQALFDDLYDAEIEEVWSKSKWQGAKEKREEPNPDAGPGEPKRWFIYDTVQPRGHFLRRYTEGDKASWHKLWRDMIYAVPRNKPMTRQAFKSRAADPKMPTREGSDAWKDLLLAEKARARGKPATAELAGSLMLAVQAVTAEAVPFEDRVETQLLLHFWPLTVRIFVPQRIGADGRSEFVGYSLAIPEVAHLGKFCDRYKRLLDHLDARPNRIRPAGAVIALPEQGPLEFLHDLDRLAAEKAASEGPAEYVAGIEFFYMVVAGNNVKLRAHGRIPVEEGLLESYAEIRREYANSEFVAGRLLALLRGRPWFAELDPPIHEREWSYFVHSAEERRRTPTAMIGFAWEVDRCFKRLQSPGPNAPKPEDPEMEQLGASPDAVDAIVYEMVRVYVRERACARADVDSKAEDWWIRTAEERRDVCAKLFLEFRSRHGDEFVGHFTDTFASVAQWLDEDRFLLVSRALMRPYADEDGPDRPRTRDDIKTLTMLALAAHSRSIRSRDAAETKDSSKTHPIAEDAK